MTWLTMADRLNEVRNTSSSPYLELHQSVEDDIPSVVDLALECQVLTQEEVDAVSTRIKGGGGGGSGRGDSDPALQNIPPSLRAMLQKFHELGLIWWYHGAPELADTIILSPQWIIDNMAFIARDFRLHRLRRDEKAMDERMDDWIALTRKAEISPAILKYNLWRNVPPHEQEFLRNILKRFLLCAEISERPGWLHFPSVLCVKSSISSSPEPEGAHKVFSFEFPFLPTGLFEKTVVSILLEWPCTEVQLQRQVVHLSLQKIRMVLVSSVSIVKEDAIEIWVQNDQAGLSGETVATLVENVWYYLSRVERLYFGGEGRVKYTPVVCDPGSSPGLVTLVDGRIYRDSSSRASPAPPPPPTAGDVSRQYEVLADTEKEAAEGDPPSAALADWLAGVHEASRYIPVHIEL